MWRLGGARGGKTSPPPELDLVMADGTRVALVQEVTLGRDPDNTVQILDPSVSRIHARISPSGDNGNPVLQDAGSSYGTWVDGHRLDGPFRLRADARIQLGDQELVVEPRLDDSEAGHTVLVPPGASVAIPSLAESKSTARPIGSHPRLRSGYALKRLEAAEGTRRWVLKDLVGKQLVRLADPEAALLQLVDGRHSFSDLVSEAEERIGPAGPARLARLLSSLSSRGLLAGAPVASSDRTDAGRRARLFRPRQKRWTGAGEFFNRAYQCGGWLLFTRPVLAVVAATGVAGLATFGYLIAARYGTPFVVARKVGLGGLVFLAGRLTFAAVHETAHGLTLASYGRKVGEAGVKLVLIFPYTFVDTSDAWFEPRHRRIAVSAAGPVCDLFIGGCFALCCLFAPAGTLRDIFFQLAFGAYYGALFNLNPLLERDGYQILVDVLRQPGLRRRSLEQLGRNIAGRRGASDSRLLGRYATFSLAWMVVVAGFAAALSLRYEPVMEAVVPRPAAWTVLAAIWVGLLAPPLVVVLPSVRERIRGGGS
jgi:putative peptide zinc metalloprotease protein